MAKISVIIPCYNVEVFLPTCLNSILNQTYQDIEILAIDDASTDKTGEILTFFEKEYKTKLKVLRNKENRGVSFSRNLGLKMAQGDYIGFVDSDDVISSTMYEALYKAIQEFGVEIASVDLERIKEDEFIHQERIYKELGSFSLLELNHSRKVANEIPACWDKLFYHPLLENISFLEGRIFEDVSFTYPLILAAKKIAKVNQEHYFYRISSNGIMASSCQNVSEQILDIFYVYADALLKVTTLQLDNEQCKILKTVLNQILYLKWDTIWNWGIPLEEQEEIASQFKKIMEFFIAQPFVLGKYITMCQPELEQLTRKIKLQKKS